MKSRQIIVKLNQFLFPYRISTSSDIFEHTILKLAGINTLPLHGRFGAGPSSPDGREQIYFEFSGLTDVDVRRLLDFFRQCGDSAAAMVSPLDDNPVFYVDADVVNSAILPLFEKEIISLVGLDSLINYRVVSIQDENLRLREILEDIFILVQAIQNTTTLNYGRGQLDALVREFKEATEAYTRHQSKDLLHTLDTLSTKMLTNPLQDVKLTKHRFAQELKSHLMQGKALMEKLGGAGTGRQEFSIFRPNLGLASGVKAESTSCIPRPLRSRYKGQPR